MKNHIKMITSSNMEQVFEAIDKKDMIMEGILNIWLKFAGDYFKECHALAKFLADNVLFFLSF